MAELIFVDDVIEDYDFLQDFPWNMDGDHGMDGGSDYLSLVFDPFVDDQEINKSYVQEADECSYQSSPPVPQDGALRARKRRVLFHDHIPDDSTITQISTKSSQKLDMNYHHSIPGRGHTLPLLGKSIDNGIQDKNNLSDAEVSQWLTDIMPDCDLNDEMTATTCNSHDPSTTVDLHMDGHIKNERCDQTVGNLSPKTPDPLRGNPSMTELAERRQLYTPPTSSQESSSASHNMYCEPFSILKPEKGLSLQNINESLRKSSPRLGQRPEAECGLHTPSSRNLRVGLSGRTIVTRIKIITEGKGTLTIIRTAN